jgi:hypothetical protein
MHAALTTVYATFLASDASLTPIDPRFRPLNSALATVCPTFLASDASLTPVDPPFRPLNSALGTVDAVFAPAGRATLVTTVSVRCWFGSADILGLCAGYTTEHTNRYGKRTGNAGKQFQFCHV